MSNQLNRPERAPKYASRHHLSTRVGYTSRHPYIHDYLRKVFRQEISNTREKLLKQTPAPTSFKFPRVGKISRRQRDTDTAEIRTAVKGAFYMGA